MAFLDPNAGKTGDEFYGGTPIGNESDTGFRWDSSKWGGQDDQVYQGQKQYGTSGAGLDVDRYRRMGSNIGSAPTYQGNYDGYRQNLAAASMARQQQGAALGLHAAAARGQTPSAAEIAGRSAIEQSLAAQMAGAQSARGGSLAQAAAMRNAAQGAGAFQQRATQGIAAERANEMAQARQAYMQGASGIRAGDYQAAGMELGKTGQELQSEQFQRHLNAQQQQFYEQRAWDTRKQEQDAALQSQQIGNQAWYQGRQAKMQDEMNERSKIKDYAGGIGGFIGGVFSDMAAKQNVVDLGGTDASSEAVELGDIDDPIPPNPYGPAQVQSRFADHQGVIQPSQNSGAIVRENPYGQPPPAAPQQVAQGGSLAGGVAGGLKGFAMFSDAAAKLVRRVDPGPRTAFETRLSERDERMFRLWKNRVAPKDSGEDYDFRGAFKAGLKPDPETAHWPDTFKKPNHETFSDESQYADYEPGRAGRRDGENYTPPGGGREPAPWLTGYMLSDAAAKRAAFEDGARYGAMNLSAPNHDAAPLPDYMRKSQPAGGAGVQRDAARSPGPAPSLDDVWNASMRDVRRTEEDKAAGRIVRRAPSEPGDGPSPDYIAARREMEAAQARQMADRAGIAAEAGASPGRQMLTFQRDPRPSMAAAARAVQVDPRAVQASMTSDERTKRALGKEQSLAEAARHLKSFAYEYKDGYRPPEQAPGEVNVGPMTQVMERNPVTATAVRHAPNGMGMIDLPKYTKVLGAIQSSQQRQIDGLAAAVARKGGGRGR